MKYRYQGGLRLGALRGNGAGPTENKPVVSIYQALEEPHGSPGSGSGLDGEEMRKPNRRKRARTL
jgi:hypothetical protein